MEKNEIMRKLSDIVLDCADKEVVLSENTDLFADLELDSIETFRVIVKAEEVFGIEFDDVDLLSENFSSIDNFCKLIQTQIEKGH